MLGWERITAYAEYDEISNPAELADAFEAWEWQERQAKFIVNSVRVYDFWGHDWWMPLWDAGFMRFWQGVPLEFLMQHPLAFYGRYNPKLMRRLVIQGIFVNGINAEVMMKETEDFLVCEATSE